LRLEDQISFKESNFHNQWKKLKQQIFERQDWKNDEKYQRISDHRNGPNGAEDCRPFLRLKGLSKKAIHHEFVAVLQENAVLSSSERRFDSVERLFWAWIRKRPHQPSSPKDDGLDEMNEAILLALSDESFSSVRQIARKICVPKRTVYRRFVNSLHFTVRHQTSSLGSSHALGQSEGKARHLESSCRSNFATFCWRSGIKDRMGIHITY
jgi:hypothetical protein